MNTKENSLIKNSFSHFYYEKWPLYIAFAYFMKGVARELKIAAFFFKNHFNKVSIRYLKKKWFHRIDKESYFDFKGAKLPDFTANREKVETFLKTFEDVFLIPLHYNDNYDKSIITVLDEYMQEGPYGYIDDKFDVTVKSGDVVIDAGAWIGDFSAYAASKDAIVYAFEPVMETFIWLQKCAELNDGRIYPVQKGLSDSDGELQITINETNSGANSFIITNANHCDKITVTSLDKFVEENKIEKIDFIKADIEGAERNMLWGATKVLQTFAPKLAICTYHLPDDPEVLEKIIKDANPNYTIVHLKKKLFASVI